MATSEQRRAFVREACRLAEQLDDEFECFNVAYSTAHPGALQIRFDNLTEAEARAVLTFARDSGLIATLQQREDADE